MYTYLDLIKASKRFLDRPYENNHKRESRRRRKKRIARLMKIKNSPFVFEYGGETNYIYF